MDKLRKLLIAAILTTAALLSTVPEAAADACSNCAANPDNCFACCRCAGGSFGECLEFCRT